MKIQITYFVCYLKIVFVFYLNLIFYVFYLFFFHKKKKRTKNQTCVSLFSLFSLFLRIENSFGTVFLSLLYLEWQKLGIVWFLFFKIVIENDF